MITFILAGIFYVVDPFLGVIVALTFPALVALDLTSDFMEVGGAVIFSATMYFMKEMRLKDNE